MAGEALTVLAGATVRSSDQISLTTQKVCSNTSLGSANAASLLEAQSRHKTWTIICQTAIIMVGIVAILCVFTFATLPRITAVRVGGV